MRLMLLVAAVAGLSGCLNEDGLTGSRVTYVDVAATATDTANGAWAIQAPYTIPADTQALRGEWRPDNYVGFWQIWLEGPNGERINGPCGADTCGPSVGNTGTSTLRPNTSVYSPGLWIMHAQGEGTGGVEVQLHATVPVP